RAERPEAVAKAPPPRDEIPTVNAAEPSPVLVTDKLRPAGAVAKKSAEPAALPATPAAGSASGQDVYQYVLTSVAWLAVPTTTSPQPGQNVYSIGNPGGSSAMWLLTAGTVRQVSRKRWTAGGMGRLFELEAEVVETSSPTNPGDSGGPLVNDRGEQVGVTQG